MLERWPSSGGILIRYATEHKQATSSDGAPSDTPCADDCAGEDA